MKQGFENRIILASASPRRAELLRQIGVGFKAMPVDLDETSLNGEAPDDYVLRLALAKARLGWELTDGRLPVLGADTAVVLDGDIFGKPRDREHAVEMLRRLSGHTHQVYSAIALVGHAGRRTKLSISKVSFCRLEEDEIQAYWETGEPRGKAGAYAIQGKGAVFIARLEGSYSGVMGLPLFETAALLQEYFAAG